VIGSAASSASAHPKYHFDQKGTEDDRQAFLLKCLVIIPLTKHGNARAYPAFCSVSGPWKAACPALGHRKLVTQRGVAGICAHLRFQQPDATRVTFPGAIGVAESRPRATPLQFRHFEIPYAQLLP
jgi:hypothetical protein